MDTWVSLPSFPCAALFYICHPLVQCNPTRCRQLLQYISAWCLQTLERSYLLRVNGKVVERPQHMLMRVSVGIHQTDIDNAIQTYHMLSERWFTHASPTLFNAGTPRPQLSSCFLICMKSDSIEVSHTDLLSAMHLTILDVKSCSTATGSCCNNK